MALIPTRDRRWSCLFCGLRNSPARATCERCSSEKPRPALTKLKPVWTSIALERGQVQYAGRLLWRWADSTLPTAYRTCRHRHPDRESAQACAEAFLSRLVRFCSRQKQG